MRTTTKQLLTLAATLLLPLGALRAADAQQPQSHAEREVIVIIKTHFDIGYTHKVKELVDLYQTRMIDKAMDIMDETSGLPVEQQFAWTCPGWVMSKVLEDWQGQTPERRKRLDDKVKTGRLKWHALPFTLESDICEPEEMARGYIFSSELSRKYGLPLSRAGKQTDVPSHGGALATVLANGGVKFMHIGCNHPSAYVKTPGLFWWEGPDGSRVLTLYSHFYGSSLKPPADWPYKVWPAIIVTVDNSGPPKAENVRKMFESLKSLKGWKARMGTMDEFADAILKENLNIPVVKGEMPDTWIHGVMSSPREIRLSREVHPRLASEEALHTQLEAWGIPQASIAGKVRLAYENILLYGEHTWGVAPAVNQYGEAFSKPNSANAARIKTLEESWEDKAGYIRTAAKLVGEMAAANAKTLSGNVKAAQGTVIVYNPLPWRRSGTVSVDGQDVFVKDVPPCGYRTIPSPKNSNPGVGTGSSISNVIESPFFKLTIDPAKGAIVSLVDKRNGREWVDSSGESGLGQYLNERFTYEQTLKYVMDYQQQRKVDRSRVSDKPYTQADLSGCLYKPHMVSEKQTPYRAAASKGGKATVKGLSAIIECPADPANHMPATILRVTLHESQPFIDLEMTIKDKAKDNWPEADWLCLPFKIAQPRFQVYRQLGVMNPVTDILDGANRDMFSVGHGVTITDADGSGIAICPIDHPLVSLDRPGCWRFSAEAAAFTPRRPAVYVNLYNNQWNTNFRYWYPGDWSSRVRLWTFDSKTPANEVMGVPAIEVRNPLVAVKADGKGDKLPDSLTGLTVSRKGTLVTAFGANPDGEGTLLRLWEQAGISGELTVTLPGRFTTAQPVNLRGEKLGEAVQVKDEKLSFAFGKYAPASFRLK
jgi:hypothetical protein